MDEILNMLPGWAMVLLGVFLIVLFFLWVLLPFAIFGTKEILGDILKEVRRTNELLVATRAGPPAANPGPLAKASNASIVRDL